MEYDNSHISGKIYTILVKRTIVIASAAVILFAARGLFAYEETKTESGIIIPPGMEIRKSGDVNVLVPRGAILHRVDDLVVLESAEEYSARKFVSVEERLDRIEGELRALKDAIKSEAGKI